MKKMTQTLNAQRSMPNAEFGGGSRLEVGRWTLHVRGFLAVPL